LAGEQDHAGDAVVLGSLCGEHALAVARAYGIGVGWVSILDQLQMPAALNIPRHWKLAAYLYIGYADAEQDQPELERAGWADRQPLEIVVLNR
jgi:5,6-dimethylbenzimidazole synthase